MEDHVHLLLQWSRTCAIAEVIKEVKRGSSLWIKERDPALALFGWQSGYGAFSIEFSQLDAVRHYIIQQEEHRRRCTFQEEFRRLLKQYRVSYDERYVWD